MAYQRLLSEAFPVVNVDDIILEETKDSGSTTPSKRHQVRRLSRMLESGVVCYLRNNKIYVRYHGQVTFRIEMNYIIPIDTDEPIPSIPPQDNRIYLENLEEYPVYLEATREGNLNQLANFWFSFVDHGLDQVRSVHGITKPDTPEPGSVQTDQPNLPHDFLSGNV